MIINHEECASTADGSHANDTHFVARNAAKERKLFSKPLTPRSSFMQSCNNYQSEEAEDNQS